MTPPKDLLTSALPQVDEERVQQMERENSFITRWNEKKDATVGSTEAAALDVFNPSPRLCMRSVLIR